MQVTVTGGVGYSPAMLKYDAKDLAYINAQALAATINSTYDVAIYYHPKHPPLTPSAGYLIIPKGAASNLINATGFGAIVDENNNGRSSTIQGGGGTVQTVIAGDGGLTYTASIGSVDLAAGGGNNFIDISGDTSASALYTSSGNDTIYGGAGSTTISAGAGQDRIFAGAGSTLVDVTGTDTVSLGAGSDTIDVLKGGSVLVYGASSVSGSGFSLLFAGGGLASTVLGGAGSYSIQGGIGGGVFTGGSAGDNSIVGGKGAVTITGGGDGDTLVGGIKSDVINAGLGNESLTGGGGANTFGFVVHEVTGTSGSGTTDLVTDYTSKDLLDVGDTLAINYALNTFSVTDGSGSFYLEDGTKVTLEGFTGHLNASNFT